MSAERIEGEGLGLGVILLGLGIALWRADRSAAPARGRAPAIPILPPTLPVQPPKVKAMPTAPLHYDPSVAAWQPIVHRLIASEFPRVNEAFAMEWINVESDGNPCAVGDPGSVAQDGNPVEIGIGQLYNPDDFKRYGVDPSAFRAYAPFARPLAQEYRDAEKALAAAEQANNAAGASSARATMAKVSRQMQTQTRALTPAELDDQARYTLLHKIADGITNADHVSQMYGLAWQSPDVWKLVKAPHAWPPILNEGMPAVVKKLGRAPASWSEFRTALGMDGMTTDAHGSPVPKFPLWVRGLNICEACGDATRPTVA